MMLRMMTPRIYFRNPGISITPKKPGVEASAVAKVMERVSNQMMIHMGVKVESKKQVQNAFFSGTGMDLVLSIHQHHKKKVHSPL